MKKAQIYGQYVKIAFSAAMAYRANFIIFSLITLAGRLLLPMVTLLIYQSGAAIPGWSLYEVLLIQAVFMLSTGFSSMFFYNIVWRVMEEIRQGTFDVLMLRPGSVVFILFAQSFDLESGGSILGGLAMFVYAAIHLPAVGIWAYMQFSFLFLIGVGVSFGLVLIMASSAFKWVGNARIFEMYQSLVNFGSYPVTIFSKAIVTLITYVIPVGMIGYYPASVILGQGDVSIYFMVIPCVILILFGMFLFRKMIYLYQSAGG